MANAEKQHQEDQRRHQESCERKKRESKATTRKIHARWRVAAREKSEGQIKHPK
jgi:hypothetical protein